MNVLAHVISIDSVQNSRKRHEKNKVSFAFNVLFSERGVGGTYLLVGYVGGSLLAY